MQLLSEIDQRLYGLESGTEQCAKCDCGADIAIKSQPPTVVKGASLQFL